MKQVYKRLRYFALGSFAVMSLGVVSQVEAKTVKTEKNNIELELIGSELVTLSELSSRSNKDYVALTLKATNKGNEEIDMSSIDFHLSSKGEEHTPESVWDRAEAFEAFSYLALPSKKTATLNLVYEISKKTKAYELDANIYQSGDNVNLSLKIDTSQFKDKRKASLEVAKTYVNKVFLDSDLPLTAQESLVSKGKPNVLLLDKKKSSIIFDNDLDKERESFLLGAAERVRSSFYEYRPSTDEALAMIKKYVSENAKRGEVTYAIDSYFPNSLTVFIKPKVVDLSTIDLSNLASDYLKSKGDTGYSDSDTAQKEAEKYVFEHLPDYFGTASVAELRYMPTDGYRLSFVKEDGKWFLDTKRFENKYDYDNLSETFSGKF